MAGQRVILHVDMDAFYAAVEQRDRLEIRGKPVIVGADPKGGRGRGIVSTCSYEARKFGIHSAQPISKAWKLCPKGIYLRPDMAKYSRVSSEIMALLREYADLVEQLSVDEAFLDVTGSRRLLGAGPAIARAIKERVRSEFKLTASVGVAPNKFLAKIASDLEKPDGLVVVEPGAEREFLAPLTIGRLWGVGAKTEAYLRGLGIQRIGQLADSSRADLIRTLGKSGEHLYQLAQGIDDRPVSAWEGYKSIGHETTFERDTLDASVLHDTLLELTRKVASRLRENHVAGRTIAVKLREQDFTTRSRRTTLPEAVNTEEKIFPIAVRILSSLVRKGKRVRLLGVYASNLEEEEPKGQLSLFRKTPAKDRILAAAVDDITRRYGGGSITRASLVPRARTDSS